jgi:uncharacterized protein YndB with AHSA1/START domain
MARMTEPDISITRVFDAPREEVWREWTEPEAFADWFGGPQADNPLSSVSMDVQPGGQWRLTMYFGPRRHEIQWLGEYQEVVPPERLVFTVTDQPDNPTFDVCTVVLTDLGDGRTEMLFEQSGGHLPPEQYKRTAEGWGAFFDSMTERLAAR